jgi:SSS family solute:Na+ symporter
MQWVALSVFATLFVGVAVLGLFASRWRAVEFTGVEQWGLAGRTLGTVMNWFLLGGDLFTAYTFIAVPALVFGQGALALYSIPYDVVIFPIVFLVMPRLWDACRKSGHVTAADYVTERFASPTLGRVVGITGILATVPYIALQMLGIEIVLAQMGVPVVGALIAAFVVLAIFTYLSGLRAPALIAIVKDVLIWITMLILIVYIPFKLGGYQRVFARVPVSKLLLAHSDYSSYVTLIVGSALALFLYPHAVTGVLSARSTQVIKRNTALLPAYTFLLGLIALLGYFAIAGNVHASPAYGANGTVPALIAKYVPAPLAGVMFGAIAIGALVPASVMSIGAANLFSRNVYNRRPVGAGRGRWELGRSRWFAVGIGIAAVGFILVVPHTYAINFQLAGGAWIIQTLPAVFGSLYIRRLHTGSVLTGLVVGVALSTYLLISDKFKTTYVFTIGDMHVSAYIALVSVIVNCIVVAVGTLAVRFLRPTPPVQVMSSVTSSAVASSD